MERELDEVTRHAVHAGIVIDSIDAKGLYTESASAEKTSPAHPRSINNMQSIANASKEAPNDALASLAYNTGGLFFHNRNDLDAGFQELGIRPDISYLLAFIPDETPNGKYRHLKVRLKGPSHNTVQARLGYMAVQPPRAKPRRVILPIIVSFKTNSNVLACDFKSLRKSRQDGALPPCTVRYFRTQVGSA